MLFWYGLAAYTVIAFILYPSAESARQTRMCLKRPIIFLLMALLVGAMFVMVFSALSDFPDRRLLGLMKLALIEAPVLAGLILLRPLRVLGLRMGQAALSADTPGRRVLAALMEPKDSPQQGTTV